MGLKKRRSKIRTKNKNTRLGRDDTSGYNWHNVCWLFGNRVLRKVCGPKRGEVTDNWRKLHIEDLHDICILVTRYYSYDQITKNEMGGACGTRGVDERCMKDSEGIPEKKMPLGRPSHGWEAIIKMDVK
jgi:hypothetical protein